MSQPREIYIFGILVFFGVFGFLYLGIGNTLYEVSDGCLDNSCIPELEGSGTYKSNTLNNDGNTLMGFVINGVKGMPSWVNWIFLIISSMLVLLLVMLLIHG